MDKTFCTHCKLELFNVPVLILFLLFITLKQAEEELLRIQVDEDQLTEGN